VHDFYVFRLGIEIGSKNGILKKYDFLTTFFMPVARRQGAFNPRNHYLPAAAFIPCSKNPSIRYSFSAYRINLPYNFFDFFSGRESVCADRNPFVLPRERLVSSNIGIAPLRAVSE